MAVVDEIWREQSARAKASERAKFQHASAGASGSNLAAETRRAGGSQTLDCRQAFGPSAVLFSGGTTGGWRA